MTGKARAERLDVGLDILAGLWSGEPFTYTGTHYTITTEGNRTFAHSPHHP